MFLSKAKFVLPLVASAFLFSANADVITIDETPADEFTSGFYYDTDYDGIYDQADIYLLSSDEKVSFDYDLSALTDYSSVKSAYLTIDYTADSETQLDICVNGSKNTFNLAATEFNYEMKDLQLDISSIDWFNQDDLSVDISFNNNDEFFGLYSLVDLNTPSAASLTVEAPEPCTSVLIFMGLGLLGFFSRKKKIA